MALRRKEAGLRVKIRVKEVELSSKQIPQRSKVTLKVKAKTMRTLSSKRALSLKLEAGKAARRKLQAKVKLLMVKVLTKLRPQLKIQVKLKILHWRL